MSLFIKRKCDFYIIPGIPPGIPPPIGGIGTSSSCSSATTHSVVSIIEAIEAAFSSAILETLVGSITPDFNKDSYLSVLALYPKSAFPSLTF